MAARSRSRSAAVRRPSSWFTAARLTSSSPDRCGRSARSATRSARSSRARAAWLRIASCSAHAWACSATTCASGCRASRVRSTRSAATGPEPGGVAQDSLVDGLGLREHGAVGLAVHAPTLLLGKVGHDRRPRCRSDEAGRTRAVPRPRPTPAGAGRGRTDGRPASRRPRSTTPARTPASSRSPPGGCSAAAPARAARSSSRSPCCPAGRASRSRSCRASSSCAPGWTRRPAPRSRR